MTSEDKWEVIGILFQDVFRNDISYVGEKKVRILTQKVKVFNVI